MIGQNLVREKIKGQIDRNKFPRFAVFIGERGSGRKALAYEVARQLDVALAPVSNKAEDIRNMIDAAYQIDLGILYVIDDSDNMSTSSANALLKVTEEPPKNAYFVLICENLDNLLPTLKSRAVTYMMEPYTYVDKCDFLDTNIALRFNMTKDDIIFALNVASNIGELKMFCAMNVKAFSDFVNLVIDNIAEVSGSNAFKIGEKIALKDESDKYSLTLFWRAFSSVCVDRMSTSDDPLKYARAVAITGDYLQQLNIRGINKSMLFDCWILDIRNEWL